MAGLKLVAELGGDGRGFEKMMDKAGGAVSGLGGKLAGLFSIGAIIAFTKSTIDWAGSLQDVADGLEVNVEWFQKMANGAALAGGKIEDLEKFIGDITKSRGEAVGGGEAGAKKTAAFGRLGISGADISTLNTEQFFKKLIDRFKSGVDAQGFNDLREVGGKSARALAAAFANQFASDAPILSADVVSQLDTMGDKFTDFWTKLRVAFAPAIIAVGNALNWFLDRVRVAQAFLGGASKGATKRTGATDALFDFKAGQRAANAELNRIEKENEQRAKGRAAALEAAKSRANAGPNFGELIEKPDKGKGVAPTKTQEIDAQVARGDMFGRAGGMVNSIANQQLEAARKAVAAQEETNRILRAMSVSGRRDGGLQLPPIR